MTTHILIVDDDEDDRDLFCAAVETIDSSIACTHAKDGEDALRLLKSTKMYRPDFIFLDLNMPRVNGKQFLIEVKKKKDLEHIPVIIYTSSKWDKDKMETRDLGAVHFITKPDKLTALYNEISFVLERQWEKPLHAK